MVPFYFEYYLQNNLNISFSYERINFALNSYFFEIQFIFAIIFFVFLINKLKKKRSRYRIIKYSCFWSNSIYQINFLSKKFISYQLWHNNIIISFFFNDLNSSNHNNEQHTYIRNNSFKNHIYICLCAYRSLTCSIV